MVLATHSHTLDTCTHTYVHAHGCIHIHSGYIARVRALAYVYVSSPSLALSLYAELRCIGVGKTGGGAIFVVVWEVREITSGERGSRSTSGETRHGEKRGGGWGRGEEGRKGVYADIRVSPVTAILRKTFDLFAHAVANPEERLIPTRMPGMPRLSPSPPCLSSFYTGPCIRPRPRTFRWTGRFSAPRLTKIQARPTARSGVPAPE